MFAGAGFPISRSHEFGNLTPFGASDFTPDAPPMRGVAGTANERDPLRPALMLHPTAHYSRAGICNTNLVARKPFEIPALKSGVCSS